MMFWNFVFAAAVMGWLLYLALGRRIDSAVGQLKHDIAENMERLNHEPELIAENNQPENDLDARVRKQIYKEFPRYGVQDMYTIAELDRAWERADGRGRVRLLRRVEAQGVCLPYELALKAVTDSDLLVREWMAKESSYLDYREARYEGASEQFTTTYVHPERDLVQPLRQDSDPFIRAALRENPIISDYGFDMRWLEEFRKCVPLERLAMMRNKKLNLNLVNRILDVDDTELNLEMDERLQLAVACLVNPNVVQNGRRSRTMDFANGYGWHLSCKVSKTVWELAAKWPEDSGVQVFAFKCVQTDDQVKADIYLRCQRTHIRTTILESCFPEDRQTLKLGRADTDPTARYIAYSRSRYMERQEIEDVLRREKGDKEKWVLDGLLENPWLGSIACELQKAIKDPQDQPLLAPSLKQVD